MQDFPLVHSWWTLTCVFPGSTKELTLLNMLRVVLWPIWEKEICTSEGTHSLPSHTPFLAQVSSSPADWNFLFLWQLSQSSILHPRDPRKLLCHLLKPGYYTKGQCRNPFLKSNFLSHSYGIECVLGYYAPSTEDRDLSLMDLEEGLHLHILLVSVLKFWSLILIRGLQHKKSV